MPETARHPVPIEQIEAFCRKYGVAEFSLFGSILRDDFRPDSDVDVLVTLEPGRTMTPESYLDMRDELSAMFGGREIDLVQKRLLTNPFRRQQILATAGCCMPPERSDDAAVFDMLQAAEGALRHTAGKTREDYEREELLRDAVEQKSKSSAKPPAG